jgi:hypothetical protein
MRRTGADARDGAGQRSVDRSHGAVGDRARAAPDGHHARLDELLDAERLEHPQQRVELVGVAGRLDRHGVRRHVDDLGAEELDRLQHVRACRQVGAHLDEEQLAPYGRRRVELDDLDDVHQLVQLLGHLLERQVLDVDHDRHPGDLRVLGRADREATRC